MAEFPASLDTSAGIDKGADVAKIKKDCFCASEVLRLDEFRYWLSKFALSNRTLVKVSGCEPETNGLPAFVDIDMSDGVVYVSLANVN